MSLTQSEMARELCLSKAVISANVKAGMPLSGVAAARQWRSAHVRQKFNERACNAAMRDLPSEPVAENGAGLKFINYPKDEFCEVLKIEFKRAETEQGKAIPVSFTASMMLAVWAVKGVLAYASHPSWDVDGACDVVTDLMDEIREGYGDALFKGSVRAERPE